MGRFLVEIITNKSGEEVQKALDKYISGDHKLHYLPGGVTYYFAPIPQPPEVHVWAQQANALNPDSTIEAIKALRVVASENGVHLGLLEAKNAIMEVKEKK